MPILVTGATGKVGYAITLALHSRGDEVRVLVRDRARAMALLPRGVQLVHGDVTDPVSLAKATAGCQLVFNAMGLPEQWCLDPAIFQAVNARGSQNLVRAARRAGVARVVHTSTIDVFHAHPGGRFDESQVADYPKGTAYERSKQHAEQLVLAAAGDDLEVVIVNPAGIYGPGPPGSASMEQALFVPIIRGRLPALPPGGMGVVNTTGLARGQLLLAANGAPGERYIFSDTHVSLRELARVVVQTAARGRVPPTLPPTLARALAAAGETVARIARRQPLLPRGQLHFFLWNAAPDSSKAQALGWRPTPLEEGIRATLGGLGLAPSA
jgi:nucleoside-diphosphate-sugar epimerase